jgi:hypothetical protein
MKMGLASVKGTMRTSLHAWSRQAALAKALNDARRQQSQAIQRALAGWERSDAKFLAEVLRAWTHEWSSQSKLWYQAISCIGSSYILSFVGLRSVRQAIARILLHKLR